jgi:hypothetical protein
VGLRGCDERQEQRERERLHGRRVDIESWVHA